MIDDDIYNNLDEYEQEIEDALNEESFKPVKNVKARIKEAQQVAANTIYKKNQIPNKLTLEAIQEIN